MAKYEKTITGDINDIVKKLHKYVMDSAVSMELIDECEYEIGNVKTFIKVYDKYYMRSSNRASLNLTVIGYDAIIKICAISAGGSQGFINFSWGVEEDFVDLIKTSLEEIGY